MGRQYHRPSGVLPCQGGDHIVDPACDRGALEGLTPYTGPNLDVEPGSRQGSHELIANGVTADTPDWRRLWASDALQVRVRAFGAEDLAGADAGTGAGGCCNAQPSATIAASAISATAAATRPGRTS